MKNLKKKRALSLFLSAALLFSQIGVTTYAEGAETVNPDCPICKDRPEQCAVPAADNGLTVTIASWEWIDPDGYLNGGALALPGVSKENPMSFDDVVSMLPEQISATVKGEPVEITLTGWACEAFQQDENGDWPVEGEYTFAAALPEGYALATDAKSLEIKVWYVNASTNELSDYSSDDVAAINAMIENNGLKAKKDDPGNWDFATWDWSTPNKVKVLQLDNENLYGTLNVTNLTDLTYLSCSNNQLAALEGLEGLTNLNYLYCSGNKLTALGGLGSLMNLTDLNCSANKLETLEGLESLTSLLSLYCGSNQLKKLDVTGLSDLKTLNCASNYLTELTRLENLTALTSLNCAGNQLTELTGLDKLTRLTNLYCDSNQLTELDVTGLTNLTALNCQSNQLTKLNVAGLTNLTDLNCQSNQLTELDVTGLTNLSSLTCYSNQLTELDVIGLTALATLYCDSNRLTELDVTGLTNLTFLSCDSNQLAELNVIDLTKLTALHCQSNQLTKLNVAGLTKLTTLNCQSNQLAELDVASLTNLTTLNCQSNQLTELNMAGLTNLTTLNCYSNQLTELDVAGLMKLTSLYCYSNQLTKLNVANLTNLTSLNCYSNQLTELDVADLTNLTSLYCYSNQLTKLDVTGLTNLTYLNCYSNQLTELDVTDLKKLVSLNCDSNQLTNLNVAGLTKLTSLTCNSNQLTELDVTDLTNLDALDCKSNQLTKLNVTGLTNLTYLYCSANQLTELDATGLTNLIYLSCSSNQLTKLDVTGLTKLTYLFCYSNQLTELTGLDKLTNLTTLDCSSNPLESFQTEEGKLTINAGTGGIISIDFIKDIKTVILTPQPDVGYKFSSWTALPDGVTPNSDNRVSFVLDKNITVGADFIVLETDTALKDLFLSTGKLTPAFDPATTSYTATVGNGVSEITITAEANDGKANVTGTGEKSLHVGENKFTVTVTAENGDYKDYSITIQREAVPDTPPSGGNSGGHNSNDDDHDSGGTTSITLPAPHEPNAPTTGTVTIGKPDKNGSVSIPGEKVTSAINDAVKAAEKNGQTKNGVAIAVNLPAGTTSATLDRAALDRLIASGVKSFKMNYDGVALTFDLPALKEIAGKTTGTLSFGASKATGLTGDALAAIGTRPAYNLTVSWQANGKTAYLDSFGAGSVSVAMAYTPAANELTGSLYAVYVTGSGKAEWIDKSSYDRNSKTVIFQTGHFSTFGVGYKAPPAFTDTANHWAKADIDFAVSRGLFSGTSETTFAPNSSMTRGMFVTALGRLAGVNPDSYKTGRFTDVKADAYYAPYVNWAAEKGIVNGTTTTTFAPDQAVTRQEMVVIMANYTKAMGCTLPKSREAITFADNSSISSWAADAVKAMQMAGIINGKDGNRFDPTGTATRGEVSAMLHRFVELVIDVQTAQGLTSPPAIR